jgi:hypothetical protein
MQGGSHQGFFCSHIIDNLYAIFISLCSDMEAISDLVEYMEELQEWLWGVSVSGGGDAESQIAATAITPGSCAAFLSKVSIAEHPSRAYLAVMRQSAKSALLFS